VQVDPYRGKPLSTFWPAPCASGRDALIAFQDSSQGVGRIRIARIRGGSKRGRALRASDTAAGAWRPALACSGARAVLAWEDDRDGPPQIYAATARTQTLN
jgi:hypothetical protein